MPEAKTALTSRRRNIEAREDVIMAGSLGLAAWVIIGLAEGNGRPRLDCGIMSGHNAHGAKGFRRVRHDGVSSLFSCTTGSACTYLRQPDQPYGRVMAQEKRSFQAEVSRLLDIVAHSLYSEKQVFLRELISNAWDACDRLRYLALTEPQLIADAPEFRVVLTPDKEKATLVVADNGIGMNRAEMIENLGTIARSGTAAFMQQLSGDAKKDIALVGQFGVGFYSAFMVSERVEVVSRKAGESEAWRWISDGKGEFTIEPAEKAERGTVITLHLHKEDIEYAESLRLRQIVKTYSDHVALPIVLAAEGKE